jgi:DUF971 family protein
MQDAPVHLDLERDRGLTVEWADGERSFFDVAFLRRMSPSAETRQLREEMARNPLTVLPSSPTHDGPLTAIDAEMVGNYAIRIRFSDGHDTGIYSWSYLRELAGQLARPAPSSPPNSEDDASR